MKRLISIAGLVGCLVICMSLAVRDSADACTNFLITKGATVDGSTMITYAADSFEFYGDLPILPATRNPPGTMRKIIGWDSGKYLGEIDEAPFTYSVVGNMNEHQVAIGETTWHGRPDLDGTEGILDYGSLMFVTLQRAKSAREAVKVMTGLVAKYGYASTGESFSISDPNEVWILEMIGKGKGHKGAVWVARKIPDGYISAHANSARIGRFPLHSRTTLYSKDVISFAREKGYYKGKDADFNFANTYAPPDFDGRRFCDARVWCMFRRAAPSVNIPVDWVNGEQADPIPLWVKPDKKLSVADVMKLMRDHYEGTELDMTKDPGAGPYQLPYRSRPLVWKVGDQEYFNERPVSTQQTGFSFVAQSRGWLPDAIGGILWFGVDDTYSTVYFPAYSSITRAPHSYARGTGSFHEVTWESAFWVFNQVSNYSYLRYSDMIKDIQVVQRELEGRFQSEIHEIDSAALALHARSPRLARDYLTKYSTKSGDMVVARWRELSKALLLKYVDGMVKDEAGNVTAPGYPASWYERVANGTGEHLKMRKLPGQKQVAETEEPGQEQRQMVEAIVTLLSGRGLVVDEKVKRELAETKDLQKLKELLVRAASVRSTAELSI